MLKQSACCRFNDILSTDISDGDQRHTVEDIRICKMHFIMWDVVERENRENSKFSNKGRAEHVL